MNQQDGRLAANRADGMNMIRIQGGHVFRLTATPKPHVLQLPQPTHVAACPRGFTIKPRLLVQVGDTVACGQPLFCDKSQPYMQWTAPGGGVVEEIRFGPRRVLEAVVIRLPPNAQDEQKVDFGSVLPAQLSSMSSQEVCKRLLQAGLWPLLQHLSPTQSYNVTAGDSSNQQLQEIYVSALAGEPHSPQPQLVLHGQQQFFVLGLLALTRLCAKTYLFTAAHSQLDLAGLRLPETVQQRCIENRYPAHHTGVQRYYTHGSLQGQASDRAAGINLDGVIRIGHLFATGHLYTERLYAVGGDAAPKAIHLRTRLGVKLEHITQSLNHIAKQTTEALHHRQQQNSSATAPNPTANNPPSQQPVQQPYRLVAGGMLTGKQVQLGDYLGLADCSVQMLPQGQQRPMLAFLRLGFDKLTASRAWASALLPRELQHTDTSANGEERACIQCGQCIKVCPVQLLPNLLLKASLLQDTQRMQELGIADCVDCGLCTFVCPSKIELGQHIETGKQQIAKEES
ncbi:MAG: 4Fe-4S dicluster domain-containing protein [Myxococcota bacterium]